MKSPYKILLEQVDEYPIKDKKKKFIRGILFKINIKPTKYGYTERGRLDFTHYLLDNYLTKANLIVDIGTSTAETTRDLKKHFKNCKVVGTEIHPDLARTAHEESRGKSVKISSYDFTSEKEPPFGKADCVRCFNVFMYLSKEKQLRLVENAFEILKTGGVFLLGTSPFSALFVKNKQGWTLEGIYKEVKKLE